MAKILFTAIVADMRNKVAGTVFSKNRGGSYARTKVTPVNPQTTFQSFVRGNFTSAAQAWRSLTELQRLAWLLVVNDYAKADVFGNIRVPAGNNVFSKLYINATTISGTPLTNPPATTPTPALTEFTPVYNSVVPSATISSPFSSVPVGQSVVIRATSQQSPGVTNVKSLYRIIAVLPAGTPYPYNLLPDYTAKFGALVAGQKIGTSTQAYDTVSFKEGPEFSKLFIVI